MAKINIKSNTNTINPLTISRPQYKDKDIEDVYLDGCDVVVVRRITADIVKRFTQSFNDKDSALNCMYSYYKDDLVKSNLKVLKDEPNTNISENDDSTVKIDNTKSEYKTFSFADDDFISTVPKADTQIKKESTNRSKYIGAYKKQVKKDSSIF